MPHTQNRYRCAYTSIHTSIRPSIHPSIHYIPSHPIPSHPIPSLPSIPSILPIPTIPSIPSIPAHPFHPSHPILIQSNQIHLCIHSVHLSIQSIQSMPYCTSMHASKNISNRMIKPCGGPKTILTPHSFGVPLKCQRICHCTAFSHLIFSTERLAI